MRDAGPQADDEGPGLLASSLAVLRLISGWACCALGVLNLGMGLDTSRGTTDVSYLVFHVVLLVAGLLLLIPARMRRLPDRPGRLTAGLVAGFGLVLSAVPTISTTCCLRTYAARHGFPFTLLARDGGRWHVEIGYALADVVFWSCVGLIILRMATLVRPPRPVIVGEPHGPHATHAEARAVRVEERTADDENVGGLP